MSSSAIVPARFSGLSFTATGWSWLRPLLSWNAGKPSPAATLIDLHGAECDHLDIGGFLARLHRIRGMGRRKPTVLGVVAARRFTKDGLAAARKAGIVIFNLHEVFGDSALDTMAKLSLLLSRVPDTVNESAETTSIPDTLANALERLTEHPFVTDLRSLGLEAVSGLLARTEGWEDVRVGTSVTIRPRSSKRRRPSRWGGLQ